MIEKPGALRFQIKLEFGNVGFWGEGKTGVPKENKNKDKDQQQTQPTLRGVQEYVRVQG